MTPSNYPPVAGALPLADQIDFLRALGDNAAADEMQEALDEAVDEGVSRGQTYRGGAGFLF